MLLSTLMTWTLLFALSYISRIFPCALSIDVKCKLCKPSWLTSHRRFASMVPRTVTFLSFDRAQQSTVTCKYCDKNTFKLLIALLLLNMQIVHNFSSLLDLVMFPSNNPYFIYKNVMFIIRQCINHGGTAGLGPNGSEINCMNYINIDR